MIEYVIDPKTHGPTTCVTAVDKITLDMLSPEQQAAMQSQRGSSLPFNPSRGPGRGI